MKIEADGAGGPKPDFQYPTRDIPPLQAARGALEQSRLHIETHEPLRHLNADAIALKLRSRRSGHSDRGPVSGPRVRKRSTEGRDRITRLSAKAYPSRLRVPAET